MIPVLRPGVTRAAAVASTGVQMTHIITLLSNISTLTSTPGLLPALLTRGVVWTRGSVSITRPSLITSCDHAVLQLGTQVSLLVTSTNANILNKQRLESKVRSWRKYILTHADNQVSSLQRNSIKCSVQLQTDQVSAEILNCNGPKEFVSIVYSLC